MLPKKYRLNQKADFQKVLKKGTMSHGKSFALSLLKAEDDQKKAGIIVSNKVSKSAAERNRIRRVLREALKEKIESIKPGSLLVFLVKTQAQGVENKVLKKEALWLLSR